MSPDPDVLLSYLSVLATFTGTVSKVGDEYLSALGVTPLPIGMLYSRLSIRGVYQLFTATCHSLPAMVAKLSEDRCSYHTSRWPGVRITSADVSSSYLIATIRTKHVGQAGCIPLSLQLSLGRVRDTNDMPEIDDLHLFRPFTAVT